MKEKCVSALELSRMTPSPSSASGGSTIGKASAHTRARSIERRRRAGIGECRDGAAVRRQRTGERVAEPPGLRIDDADPVALHSHHGRQGAHLAQPPTGAGRQIEPRRIGAVDDIDVVIARQHQRALRKPRMALERGQELGPFRRPAGIGHVAGDEHQVERPLGVDGIEPGQQPLQPGIAARRRRVRSRCGIRSARRRRAGPTGVRHATSGRPAAAAVEGGQVARLIHGRVGEPPDERSRCKVASEEHDGVGQRRNDETLGPDQVPDIADPA